MKEKVEKFIETNKFWIGGVIILLITLGSSILLYRENYSKVSYDEKVSKLESKITGLESSIETLKQNNQVPSVATNNAVEESVSPEIASSSGSIAGTSTKSSTPAPITGMININKASTTELDTLPGIGPVYAQRIVDYRTSNGPFKSIEEIKNIKGIGDKTFEKFKDKISIN